MRVMDRFRLATLLDSILVLLFAGMTLAFFLQVVFRYVIDLPLGWTEEITKLLFAWVSFLGTAILFREKGLTTIDMVVSHIPKHWQFSIELAIKMGVALALILISYFGIVVSIRLSRESFITFNLSRFYLYSPLPISCMIMSYYNILDMIDSIRRHSRMQGGLNHAPH